MHKIMTVFGIRPDFIRASILLKKLAAHPEVELQFVYTGQHYDENLKGVFFKELGIPEPDIHLDCIGKNHNEQHAKLILQLSDVLEKFQPEVVLFLGDANAVIGCIAPLKLGIPIAHVEAGMRSYDWRMPEERNRVIVDRVSDVLYCYQHDYKYRLIQEGVDPDKIVVTGNTIVDVLAENMGNIISVEDEILASRGLEPGKYAIHTMHRDENMSVEKVKTIMLQINEWAIDHNMLVVLPVMPRLQEIFNKNRSTFTTDTFSNYFFTEPLGFLEFVALEMNAAIEFTDSGTNQETSAIMGVPCVVTRRSTERPETFDSGITVMAEKDNIYHAATYVYEKAKYNPEFALGDGNAAQIIIDDLLYRLKNGFVKHQPPISNFMARNWQQWRP